MRTNKILLLMIILMSPIALAQNGYFGLSASLIASTFGAKAMPAVQFAVKLEENLDLRISIDSDFKTTLLSADILNANNPIAENSSYYIGSGLDIALEANNVNRVFPIALHFTAGYEQAFDQLGLFVEIQPMLSFEQIFLRSRIGINVHY